MKEIGWQILAALRGTGSITKSAELLHMTQPTLTKHLQQMEAELGVKIAIRNSKGIRLTPQGDYLAQEAALLLDEFQRIRDRLVKIGSGDCGAISLGVTNSFGRYTLPPLLKKYREQYPQVSFQISAGVSSQVFEMVQNRTVHIGFVRGETAFGFDGYTHLISEDHVLAAANKPFSLADLPSMPQICYTIDPQTAKMIDRWWYSYFSAPPIIGVNTHNGDTCRKMVEEGLGYAIFTVPSFLEHSPDLYRLPLYKKSGEPLKRYSWMICKQDFCDIPLYQSFIRFMQEQLKPAHA